MKHVLVSCDSCGKVVPHEALTRGWWGHKKSGIQIVFAPITKRNRGEFETGHVCSELCLAAVLKSYAETMDRKAEKTTIASSSLSPFFFDMFGTPGSNAADSIGYYGKKKEETDEDND